jgi:hypothetical protein
MQLRGRRGEVVRVITSTWTFGQHPDSTTAGPEDRGDLDGEQYATGRTLRSGRWSKIEDT